MNLPVAPLAAHCGLQEACQPTHMITPFPTALQCLCGGDSMSLPLFLTIPTYRRYSGQYQATMPAGHNEQCMDTGIDSP